MLSSHQATISDAQRFKKSGSYNSEQSRSGNIKKAQEQMHWKSQQKARLNMQNIRKQYLVLSSSPFPTSDEQRNQIYDSLVFSSYQATIQDTEDWNNLDQIIVTYQGLEVTR